MASFWHLSEGDRVTRLLAGKVPMQMVVVEVRDSVVVCGTPDLMNGGWTFDRETGVEEDEELGWGVRFGRTGSFLTNEKHHGN